ncbi:hypothetical protein N7468_005334 [Penicillium chermesinum]|uniref:Cysteine-rich transmembrane CYSTM domain-containing protein n=1 Tax=Penicillium chermesinum TaxID=63820 RepID=A0A9W9P1L9_9EURO|nr:uncharacterized protein N7468_005334 [Penicillium chermesinum]KAJ5232378.1 hypothetical protein N7468_005334 [Penicillium chermesinum]KAJ6172036.1 hypothetical protein N7470_001103 [Penicillium chermesinum]
MAGFFDFFKFSSSKECEHSSENNTNLTALSNQPNEQSTGQNLQPVNLGASTMRMEPQPEQQQMNLRGGGAGECCCGICAGLACFECCEICC